MFFDPASNNEVLIFKSNLRYIAQCSNQFRISVGWILISVPEAITPARQESVRVALTQLVIPPANILACNAQRNYPVIALEPSAFIVRKLSAIKPRSFYSRNWKHL